MFLGLFIKAVYNLWAKEKSGNKAERLYTHSSVRLRTKTKPKN